MEEAKVNRQYALQGIRGILEFEAGWTELSTTFIDRMLALLLTATQPNILRPATAIVRKLVISSPQLSGEGSGIETPLAPLRGKGKGKAREGAAASAAKGSRSPAEFGFEKVFERMQVVGMAVESDVEGQDGAEKIFMMLAKRLEGRGDLELVAQRWVHLGGE
jgi:hypothetical protein